MLAFAAQAHADALGSLRTTLQGLSAGKPLRATLELRSVTHDDGQSQPAQATLRIGVTSDAAGLHLDFAPDLLRRAADEAAAHARNKDRPTPIADLLDQVGATQVQAMVDFAPALLRMLDGATLAGQASSTHDGIPARLLTFDVPMPPSASKQMTVKRYVDRVQVWLDASGLPVAVRETTALDGRKLFISIDFDSTSDYELRVVAGRLVAVSRHTVQHQAVFGHGSDSVIDATLTPDGN